MPNARYDLGRVASVKAEAIGEPGQRTFRLLLDGPKGGACMWMEKEQLSQLSMAIRQLISLSESEGSPVYPSPPPAEPSGGSGDPVDFRVGKLSLGHDPRQDLFIIEAHDREDDQDGDPLLEFWASRSQMKGPRRGGPDGRRRRSAPVPALQRSHGARAPRLPAYQRAQLLQADLNALPDSRGSLRRAAIPGLPQTTWIRREGRRPPQTI